MENLCINSTEVCSTLTEALAAEVTQRNFNRVILGLSGGIDSAVSLYLAVKAMGAKNVLAVSMPYRTSNPSNTNDAHMLANQLAVKLYTEDITPQIDAYFSNHSNATPLRKGNKMARERMSILYDLSAENNALVLGTSNRTEILLGYGTQFGDTASAINPLGNLYKTQVKQLATYMGVPETIINKAPSADLWDGQTDEGELGASYADIDQVLYFMFDRNYSSKQILSLRFTDSLVKMVCNRVQKYSFKREMPLVLGLKQECRV